jgi:hypothetical protein
MRESTIMLAFRITALVFASLVSCVLWACTVAAQSPGAVAFSAQEQQARQKVLDSQNWKDARAKFDRWLSVQVAYDPAEVEAMKAALAARIARSSAQELTALLQEMQQRLDVLLSPDVVAARDWADSFYTPKGIKELTTKHGMANPMAMSGRDLTVALEKFQADRASQRTANKAFMQLQAKAVDAAQTTRQQQAAAAAAAAARPSATFGAAYAPTRSGPPQPQRYQAPYNPVRYSIGPWGGVWVGH